jgi:hypothetical protein
MSRTRRPSALVKKLKAYKAEGKTKSWLEAYERKWLETDAHIKNRKNKRQFTH